MQRILFCLAAALCFCGVLPAATGASFTSLPAAKWPRISAINDAAFKLEAFAGNGFLLEHNNRLYAVTAKHVLILAASASVTTTDIPRDLIASWTMHPNGEARDAISLGRLLNADPQERIDMAIAQKDWLFFEVASNKSSLKPLRLRRRPLVAGETVYLVGCSYRRASTCKQDVYPGKFVRHAGANLLLEMADDQGEPAHFGGMSGSPVIDTEGEVVGITSDEAPNPNGKGMLQAPASIDYALEALAKITAAAPRSVSGAPITMADAIAGDWRSGEHKARDRYRHPAETLDLFGIKPDMRVIEITPGTGWYTEVLAPLLQARGHYIAAVQSDSGPEDRRDLQAWREIIAAGPAHYGAVEVRQFSLAAPDLGQPESADAVLTFRNVHNWESAGAAKAMLQAFFAVLKPGGILGVTDHRAVADSDPKFSVRSGYVDQNYVIGLAKEAGFQLVEASEINANDRDTKDYPIGVWALPPTLAMGQKDREKLQAIGESDRMTLKFVKPRTVTP